MSRATLWAGMALLCISGSAFSQTDENSGDQGAHLRDGLVSFGHDPECPGCRAFLAGYGAAEAMHSPSCNCDAAMADGGAGGPMAVGEDYQELVASDFGAGMGYDSAAPGMIGDFFGGGYRIRLDEFKTFSQEYTNIAIAGGDRRFKLAENNSPFPIDRVFFNFNHFHNALRTANSHDAHLNRGVAGLEKTFLDQWWSFEFRLPFLSGLNGDQVMNSQTADNVSNEFGNIALALKRLLFRTDTLAASMGLGIVLPTGPDARFFDSPGDITPIVTLENDAYYLQPFAGLWWTPNERFFAQYSIQADFDARGNGVFVSGNGPGREGVIQDQTLMFLDASFGYWLFRDPYGDRLVTGIAPMIELHHSTTLQDSDLVNLDSAVGGSVPADNAITNPFNRMDVLNLTGAIRLEIAGRSYLTFAGVMPLRTEEEKLFDAEFGVQYTRFY